MSINPPRIATTSDGKRVVLKDDGTWEYQRPLTEAGTTDATSLQTAFRKAVWGMTKDQVKSAEELELSDESNTGLYYDGRLMGLDCLIAYIFAVGQLVRAKYLIEQQHSNDNEYMTDFQTLKEMLTKKYGQPASDDMLWLDDLYQDNYQSWGMALSAGHLKFYTNWKTADTNVLLYLGGDNYRVELGIEYASLRLGHLEDKEKERQALDML